MKKTFLLVLLVIVACGAGCDHASHVPPPPGPAPAANAVQAEMRLLSATLESGAYRLPKNPEQVARFRELDTAFHGGLERLVDASHRNDLPATAAAVGVVLQGCPGCHSEFRP